MSKTIFVHYVVLAEENEKLVISGEGSMFYDMEVVKSYCSEEENVFKAIYDDLNHAARPGTTRVIRNIQILEI